MFLSVKKVFCVHVCLHVLCFVRTVRNLKPHLGSVACTNVLILLSDGINCAYRVSTFGQCVMNSHYPELGKCETPERVLFTEKAVSAQCYIRGSGAFTLSQPNPVLSPSPAP